MKSSETKLRDVLDRVEATELTILCGAGVSTPPPSSIPTVAHFIQACLDATSAATAMREAIAKRALRYPQPRFEVLIEQIRTRWDPDLRVARIFDSPHSTDMHRYLVRMCASGAAIITTNFDNCIERVGSNVLNRIVFDGHDLQGSPDNSCVLIKAHGSHPLLPKTPTELVISISSLARTAKGYAEYPRWRRYLRQLIDKRTLFVLGYSGSDDFDLMPILCESNPKTVCWLKYDANAGPAHEVHCDALEPSIMNSLPSTDLRVFRGIFEADASQRLDTHQVIAQDQSHEMARPVATTEAWVNELFPTPSDKRCLLATIGLYHGAYHEVCGLLQESKDPRERSLLARAMYFSSDYRNALFILAQLDAFTLPAHIAAQNAHVESACHNYLGNHTQGLDAAYKFCELANGLANSPTAAEAHVNLAASLAFGKRYSEAEREYLHAKSLLVNSPSLEALAKVHWGLADVSLVEGRFEHALRDYEEALRTFKKLGSEIPIAWLLRSCGEALTLMRKPNDAHDVLRQAEEIFVRNSHRMGLAYVFYDYSRLEWVRGNHDTCYEHSLAAIEFLDRNTRSPITVNVLCMAWLIGDTTGQQYSHEQFCRDFNANGVDEIINHHGSDPNGHLLAELLQSSSITSKQKRDAVETALFPKQE